MIAGERDRWVPHLWPIEAPTAVRFDAREFAWIVGRYDDVRAILQSEDFASLDASPRIARIARSMAFDVSNLVVVLDSLMLLLNGESHRDARAAFTALLPALLGRWTRPRLQTLARTLADGIEPGVAIDLVPVFVDLLPNTIAADMLGLSPESIRLVREWNLEVLTCWRSAVPARRYRLLEQLARQIRALYDDPARSFAHVPLPSHASPWPRAVENIFAMSTTLTTSGTLGAAILMLAKSPQRQRLLRSRSDLVPAFVDEVLRIAGSVRRLGRRTALRAVEIGGQPIAAGATVIVDIEAAGHDARAYPDPDAIDLTRDAVPTFAFGGGAHPCMGPRLARTEIACAIEALLARFTIALAGEPVIDPEHRDLRQFTHLFVRLDPVTLLEA